ncbi:GTP-binding protein sar1 [Spraguea lophii 42_110]|uniref:Small COPII coat GTPase SAR1 n=1 Tax=Spraguea lophii (strain 42_110) TaxID=1358809 RepID=S7WAI5_SPRLO|nr:GTP-binding protein sar1 [Spraguea lophii 42_110]
MAEFVEYIYAIKDKIHEIYEKTFGSLIRQLFTKPASILFLGIDNAGKTTLLNKLRDNTTNTYAPTRHPQKNEVEIGNLKANVVDLGGHEAARLAWEQYYYDCNGIVFIVDVNDKERFPIVKKVYDELRSTVVNKRHLKVPIVVLMNKIDILGHTTESAEDDPQFIDMLTENLGIENEGEDSGQPVRIFYLSIKEESPNNMNGSLVQAFQWLSKMISLKEAKTNADL